MPPEKCDEMNGKWMECRTPSTCQIPRVHLGEKKSALPSVNAEQKPTQVFKRPTLLINIWYMKKQMIIMQFDIL